MKVTMNNVRNMALKLGVQLVRTQRPGDGTIWYEFMLPDGVYAIKVGTREAYEYLNGWYDAMQFSKNREKGAAA